MTNYDDEKGTLDDVIKNSHVFIGVSKGGCVKSDIIYKMASNPIIFVISQPEPEFHPSEAMEAGALCVATARPDFPNQINNIYI